MGIDSVLTMSTKGMARRPSERGDARKWSRGVRPLKDSCVLEEGGSAGATYREKLFLKKHHFQLSISRRERIVGLKDGGDGRSIKTALEGQEQKVKLLILGRRPFIVG